MKKVLVLTFFPPMSILLVTGSRDITDRDRVFQILDDVARSIGPITRVLHGGARGVDWLAGQWAEARHLDCEVWPADWSTGRGAGYVRNAQMVEAATDVVAIWDGQSKGTKHCMTIAEKAGKLRVSMVISS